jgi:hypothetical protein
MAKYHLEPELERLIYGVNAHEKRRRRGRKEREERRASHCNI